VGLKVDEAWSQMHTPSREDPRPEAEDTYRGLRCQLSAEYALDSSKG
jgi:hypothetical protein